MKKYIAYTLIVFHVFFTGNFSMFLHLNISDRISKAGAVATATLYAGTATDLLNSSFTWANPTNAQGNTTTTFSQVSLTANPSLSNTLALRNFNILGQSIATGSTINGIQVAVEWLGSNASVVDTTVQLTKNGTAGVGSNLGLGTSQTTKGIRNYGGLTNLWGTTWTKAELESTNFGVLLRYNKTGAGTRTANVYRVSVTVDYTTPPTIPALSVTNVENDADNTVTTSQIVQYTTSITNTGSNASSISSVNTISTNVGTPYNINYSSCGSATSSFSSPNLTVSSISVLSGQTCVITYDTQVNSGAPSGATITNSADVSAAVEGGNNPASVAATTLTVLACGVNNVNLVFETDGFGEDVFWSLTPGGNACGIGQVASGGNTSLTCSSGGTPATATAGQPYADNATITEGPYSLTVGTTYDLHVIDDYGDGNTAADPDVRIQQNGGDTNTYAVTGNGGVFSFIVQAPVGCSDTTKPNVTINQAPSQLDPTGINSATFKVVFNEVINTGTFTASDISLSGTTGTITSGPTQVSPNNGTSFELTVTGMTIGNTVTATIPAGGVQDIAGNTNNISTSTDNSITYNGVPPSVPNLWVTHNDNDADNTVSTSQIVRYTTTILNSGTGATGISSVNGIGTNVGTPYNINYSSCGSPTSSFSTPNITFSSISISSGNTCTISYDVQVNSGAPSGATITNSADVSAAVEGGNNPASVSADILTVLACGVNNVTIDYVTDNWGYETFWSLTPGGNACNIGQIATGGNTTQVSCTSGGSRVASTGNGYGNNTTIATGPFSLTVGNTYDLHVVDDYGDGITTSPDVTVRQNGSTTDTFVVAGNGGVFSFTVQAPIGCADTVKPNVTINQAPSQIDPTAINSATFKVVFNEVINTGSFTASDISLAGTTGTITSGPTQVSPNNGTSFEFTVTGMTAGDTVTATLPAGGVQDIAGNTNTVSTSTDNQVTFTGGDTTPPTISSLNFASGSLFPGGNHNIVINYFDADSGINTASASMILNKWNGSAWGGNISGTGLSTATITTTGATYPTNNLIFGKYRYIFQVSDIAGNISTATGATFYIDQPEFIISTGSIDIGSVNSFGNSFSPTVTVTVKTIGAGFNVVMNANSNLTYTTESIPTWNGTNGFGYDISPYTTNISTITTNQNIATQAISINTNGNLNTYTYQIKLGARVGANQSAGDYLGNINFGLNLNY